MTESLAHAYTKNDLYWLFQSQDIFTETEKVIGLNRTDLSTEVNGVPLAIEVQTSYISEKTILSRMKGHSNKGYHTLWIFTDEKPTSWKLAIQRKQLGVIFIFKGGKLWPARIENELDHNIQATNKKYIYYHDESIEFEELIFCTENGLKSVTFDIGWLESYFELL